MSNISTISVNLPRLIVPKRHVDDRGWLSEIFHRERLRDIGITCRFVQDNQSSSKHTGTLRGLHFQLPPAAQAKLVTVVNGRILDVVVDIRRGLPTFGKYVSTEFVMYKTSGLLCTGPRERDSLERPGNLVSMAIKGRQHDHLGQGSATSAAQRIRQSVCVRRPAACANNGFRTQIIEKEL